jgi:hypothetical protein
MVTTRLTVSLQNRLTDSTEIQIRLSLGEGATRHPPLAYKPSTRHLRLLPSSGKEDVCYSSCLSACGYSNTALHPQIK